MDTRLCHHCETPLPADAPARARYCGRVCKTNAQRKRKRAEAAGRPFTPAASPDPRTNLERMEAARQSCDTNEQGCWLWTRARFRTGYGATMFRRDGRVITTAAHRAAYEVWVGPIPEGESIHHTCGVRECFRPDHLQPITQRENMAEMLERRTYQARIVALEGRVLELETALAAATQTPCCAHSRV